MSEQHIIKIVRSDAKDITGEKQNINESEKIANFIWNDELGVKQESELPSFVANDTDIDECVDLIITYVLSNLSITHFDGLKFILEIEPTLHYILSQRFSNKWNLESRLLNFSTIQKKLQLKFENAILRDKLNQCIDSIMPSSQRKTMFFSGKINIIDDVIALEDKVNSLFISFCVKKTPWSFAKGMN